MVIIWEIVMGYHGNHIKILKTDLKVMFAMFARLKLNIPRTFKNICYFLKICFQQFFFSFLTFLLSKMKHNQPVSIWEMKGHKELQSVLVYEVKLYLRQCMYKKDTKHVVISVKMFKVSVINDLCIITSTNIIKLPITK